MPALNPRVRPIATPAERHAWNGLAEGRVIGHRHQCLWWMESLERYGFRSRAIGCWNNGRLVGGALFRSYPVPFTGGTISECLDGPVFLEWESGWADDFAGGIVDLARQFNSMAVVIAGCPQADVHRDLTAALQHRGLTTTSTRGPADAVLPLEGRTIEEIRKGFNHGTRQRIKKGQVGPLSLRRLTSGEDLALAYQAWIATANRKSFTDVRPWPGLEPVLRYSVDNGLGSVIGSFLDGRLLASAFIVHIGQTTAWVYGGYMDGAEKYSPTHVLQFEAIRESLERGTAGYNFGNLLAEDQPSAKGVDEFKLGFGASAHRHLDTIVWKRRPFLYGAIEQLRRRNVGRAMEALLKRKMIRGGSNSRTIA